jgi:hypothetical protein
VTPADVTDRRRTPYEQMRDCALAAACPHCGARRWWPCVTGEEVNLPLCTSRYTEGLRQEFPTITSKREQARLLRRRWEIAI